MNLREKEALGLLVTTAAALAIATCCWMARSGDYLWMLGPPYLAYGIYIAIAHRQERAQRHATYDERDRMIEGRAFRAAYQVSGIVFSALLLAVWYWTDTGYAPPRWALFGGYLMCLLAGQTTWALVTLYHSHRDGMAHAHRQPGA